MADVVDEAEKTTTKFADMALNQSANFLASRVGNDSSFCVSCDEEIGEDRRKALGTPLRCTACQSARDRL